MMNRIFAKLAKGFLVVAFLSAVAAAMGETAFLTGLGTAFTANALSRNGQVVVGVDTTNDVAAYWSGGTITDITSAGPGSNAVCCNADGSIIGGTDLQAEPFIWVKGGIFQELATLQGTSSGVVTMISADGSVMAGNCEGLPTIWTASGAHAVPGTNGGAVMNSLSDDGSTLSVDLHGTYEPYSTNITSAASGILVGQTPQLFTISGLGEVVSAVTPPQYNPFSQTPYENIFCLTSDGSKGFGAAYDLYYVKDNKYFEFLPETDGFWTIQATSTSAENVWFLRDFEAHSCNQDGSVLAGQAISETYGQNESSINYLTSINLGNATIAYAGASYDLSAFLTGRGASTTGWTLGSIGTQAMSSDGSVILGKGTDPQNETENWIARVIPSVSSFSASQSSFVGGTSIQATVGLDYPSAGTAISVISNNTAVIPNASVLIPEGAIAGTSAIASKAVATATTVQLAAKSALTTKTITVTVTPVLYPITEFYPSASTAVGGNAVTGYIRLQGIAAAAGDVVTLKSNNSDITVPATVTVPAGTITTSFAITSKPVTAVTQVTLTATLGTSTEYTVINVIPATVSLVRVAPSPVVGGVGTKCAVYLNGAAPTGGKAVAVSCNSTLATFPASITVPAGATAANASVTTSPVSAPTTVVVTAKTAAVSTETTFVINPAPLSNIKTAATTLVGGKATTLTITLTGKAGPSGLIVQLITDNPAVVVPASVLVPAGGTTVTVNISTVKVTADAPVTITAFTPTSLAVCALTLTP